MPASRNNPSGTARHGEQKHALQSQGAHRAEQGRDEILEVGRQGGGGASIFEARRQLPNGVAHLLSDVGFVIDALQQAVLDDLEVVGPNDGGLMPSAMHKLKDAPCTAGPATWLCAGAGIPTAVCR